MLALLALLIVALALSSVIIFASTQSVGRGLFLLVIWWNLLIKFALALAVSFSVIFVTAVQLIIGVIVRVPGPVLQATPSILVVLAKLKVHNYALLFRDKTPGSNSKRKKTSTKKKRGKHKGKQNQANTASDNPYLG